ncbi:hypothetical protein [Streptomyces cucumeris]|uniref:hypothetical protein n=1 Tax=Streptomyces cucumeris TaxID=2962890 RepID=UPI003D709362
MKIGTETADTAPPEQTAPWEEVVEISVRSVEGEPRVASAHDAVLTELPVLNPRGTGLVPRQSARPGTGVEPRRDEHRAHRALSRHRLATGTGAPMVLRSSPLIVETQLAHADDPPWERR